MTLETKEFPIRKVSPNTWWTIEIMASAILTLKENGEPINAKYLESNYRHLYNRIQNYPGGWIEVVSFAGFDPNEEIHTLGRRRIGARLDRLR